MQKAVMGDKILATRLEAVAGMAKSLAYDVKNGQLWEGETSKRLSAINEELKRAIEESPDVRGRIQERR